MAKLNLPAMTTTKRRHLALIALLLVVAMAGFLVLGRAEAQAQESNWMTPPAIQPGDRARMIYMTGNDFIAQCENSTVVCTAYLQGINDGLLAATFGTSRDVPYCIPSGTTPAQVLDVVLEFIERHPEEMHQPAAAIIVSALSWVWPPCTENP